MNKLTYSSSKHFFGGNGPTSDFPDPIPATFTPIETTGDQWHVNDVVLKKKNNNSQLSTLILEILKQVAKIIPNLSN